MRKKKFAMKINATMLLCAGATGGGGSEEELAQFYGIGCERLSTDSYALGGTTERLLRDEIARRHLASASSFLGSFLHC